MGGLPPDVIIGLVISAITGLGGYLVKTVLSRVSVLEDRIQNKLDHEQVRQLVSDKVDPIREDISEIKADLKRITDILLSGKH